MLFRVQIDWCPGPRPLWNRKLASGNEAEVVAVTVWLESMSVRGWSKAREEGEGEGSGKK